MPTEVATFIEELDPTRPADTETAGEADDHLRLLKSTINNTFLGSVGDLWDIGLATGPRAIDAFDGRLDGIEANYMKLDVQQLVLVEHEFQTGMKLSNNATLDGEDLAGTTDFNLIGVDVNDIIQAGTLTQDFKVSAPDNKFVATFNAADSVVLLQDNFILQMGQTLVDTLFPIGAVYLTFTNTNPGTFLPGTSTWANEAAGRFIVGVGTGTDANTFQRAYAAGDDSVGEYTHVQIEAELALHGHPFRINSAVQSGMNAGADGAFGIGTGGTPTIANFTFTGVPTNTLGEQIGGTGADTAMENSPAAYGAYLWRRTA